MKRPPFTLNSSILNFISEIQTFLGEVKSLSLQKPSIKLRRENKIKTIHHSLAIEGNTLSEEEISSVLDGKRVLGPKKQIVEVKNAIQVYQRMNEFKPASEKDLLRAHQLLMHGLLDNPGKYRTGAVGIFKGGKVSRMAPSEKIVPKLMGNLFQFLKLDKETHALLKACIFHYELEFIHPFADGNGRMGRLWQQLLLIRVSPIFEFLPIESLIHKEQKRYYSALEQSDKQGESTEFI